MAVDDVIAERLVYLRNEVPYLKMERDRVRSLRLYTENTRLRKAVDRALLRHLVVHEYTKIDDAKVYAIFKKRLGDFDAFTEAVLAYLEKAQA